MGGGGVEFTGVISNLNDKLETLLITRPAHKYVIHMWIGEVGIVQNCAVKTVKKLQRNLFIDYGSFRCYLLLENVCRKLPNTT